MRHDIHVEGFDLRLRPVRMEDAAFIVWLRGLDHVRGNVGNSATSVAGQMAWLEEYFERDGDYYFIVETPGGIPMGTHGLYEVNGRSGETGRYIMRPEVLAGPPSSVLAMDIAFGQLGLTELRSSSVSTNVHVHSLHRKFGFKEVSVSRGAQMIEGRPVDLVHFILTAEEWARTRDRQLPLANLAGIQVLEWEKTQLGKTQPWVGTRSANVPALGLMVERVLGTGSEEELEFWVLEAMSRKILCWLEQASADLMEILNCCPV